MANFFYFDSTGTKQGPYDSVQLTALAKNGSITPDTLVENESGKQTKAKNITGLFPHPVPPPISVPLPESNTDTPSLGNPFIDPSFAAVTSCPHCGKPMTASEKFCGSCGKSQNSGSGKDGGGNTGIIGFLDIGFTRFITPSWISAIWIICIVLNVISFLASVVWTVMIADVMSQESSGWGNGVTNDPVVATFVFISGLLASIILHLLMLLLDRIFLEVVIVLFRIERNTRETEENTRAMLSKQQ